MSSFEVLVRTIDEVVDHPNADRLSIVKILGFDAIAAKNDDGTHRFQKGEPVVYVPEGAVIPEDVLKERGYWNEEKNVGMLAGKAGDRVKAIRLRQIFSQGLLFKIDTHFEQGDIAGYFVVRESLRPDAHKLDVSVGQDVADFFGITKYEPPIPASMAGEVASIHEFAIVYDIENSQNFPGFLDHDEVEATEKLHGTNFRIAYRPGLNHEEMFGPTGCVGIASKGLGAKGLVFKNNEKNVGNIYVRTARDLCLIERIHAYGELAGVSIDLFGEIFGPGVQDLTYGVAAPTFRAFDIAINGVFQDADTKAALFAALGVERVPVLYRGPWDRDVLLDHRDGKTVLGGQNIREGIVVTAVGSQEKREVAGRRLRPFLKMVSPDYLLRKNGTEFN